MSGILTQGLNRPSGAGNIFTLGLGPGNTPSLNPIITNISPADGDIADVGASSRFSLRDADTEVNLSKLQVYLGTGPVFYPGGELPEKMEGPPTFYFQALAGSPGVYADRVILPDGYLCISKLLGENQEAVYFMGGLEAYAEPDGAMMMEFNLRLDKNEVSVDGSGFTGVVVGLLIGNSGLTIKFFVQTGLPRIEIQDAGSSTTTPPSGDYVNYFDWDVAAAANPDGSNTYKLLWYPLRDLVRLYVKEPGVTDRLLIDGTVAAFPLVPVLERRDQQPWMFFGHGVAPDQTSVSDWKDVYLYNYVTNPVGDGIITGGHITELTTNNPTYYPAAALPRDSHCAWERLPDSFGTIGGGEFLSQDGLELIRTHTGESIGFFRHEPKTTETTVFDILLTGEVTSQEPGVATSGIEFYVDDGTKQARVALLQDVNGTQYVGLAKSLTSPESLAAYVASIQSFGIERHYRLILTPGDKATLVVLVPGGEGLEEQPVVSLAYSVLPASGMPGPGVGFLHNANSGGATAKMTVRQVRYTTSTEIADQDDFDAGAWTQMGSGTFALMTDPDVGAFGRITDLDSTDNTYFKKEYPAIRLQPDNGWSLEFRSRIVSYEHDPALTEYLASGLNPIRAFTGFMTQVLDGSTRAAIVFAEAGPPLGKIVFLALLDSTLDNLLAIRSGSSTVLGSYYAVDWTKFHLYRLEKTVGGMLSLYVDGILVVEFPNRLVDYPPHGSGNPRVEIGHTEADHTVPETGIRTISDFQMVKFAISDGFDVSTRPVLTEEELLARFSCATNVLVEAEDL